MIVRRRARVHHDGRCLQCAAPCASRAARSAGRCRWPLTRRNCLPASILPTAHQRSAMVPFCQFFTSLEWVRAMEIIDSTQSVLRSVPLIVLLHNGPLSWVDLAVAQHLPQGRCQGDRHLNFHESRDKSIALTRKAPAYGVGQGFQRTGPARSGGSSTGPVHETKTGSASAMVGNGRVGDCCVVYRWS
jgi:hypothetical protein